MASDGGSEQRLTTHPAVDHRPHWSPDGARIVFGTNRDGNFEVYVMNADGTDVMRLKESPVWGIVPRLSPDGKIIVFASGYVGGPEADVHLMRATGGEERALTSYPGRDETIA